MAKLFDEIMKGKSGRRKTLVERWREDDCPISVIKAVEKNNPWHDPSNGRFTSGPGGAGGGASYGITQEQQEKLTSLIQSGAIFSAVKYKKEIGMDDDEYKKLKESIQGKKPEPKPKTEKPKEKPELSAEAKERVSRYQAERQAKIDKVAEVCDVDQEKAKEYFEALDDWSGGGYIGVRALQSGRLSDYPNYTEDDIAKTKKQAEAIENYINDAPPYSGTLYRGIGVDANHFKVGDQVDMQGTSSWSSSKDMAEDFALGEGGGRKSVVLVSTKKISKAASIESIVQTGEDEVLVSKDVKYVVKKITSSGGIDYVYVEELVDTIGKRFDQIVEIDKFNPYHDAKGRFATSGSFTSFTYAPGKSKAHDKAIERMKERTAARMPTAAQEKTLKGIETRTRNLKKEQFRVVDRDGNVVMQKQGDEHSVTYTIGEAREHIPGNITIHNHPDGGTFSTADLSDIGYGATEIRAAAPEGTYILRNARYGGKYNAAREKTWYDMRDDLEAASGEFKTSRQIRKEIRKPYDEELQPIVKKWEKLVKEGAPQEERDALAKEYTSKSEKLVPLIDAATRKAFVDQYHHWYKSNAGNYGLEYDFIPAKTRTRKGVMMDHFTEIEKSDDLIVLDKQMNDDIKALAAEIMAEIMADCPPIQKSATPFNIFKTDQDKRLVFGWASVAITADGQQIEDVQKDMIDPEDLEEAAYSYVLNFRDTGEEHIPSLRKKGKLVESCVFTKEKQQAIGIPEGIVPEAWWVGFYIEDDEAWEKIKNGTYTMFSIEGKAKRVSVEKADKEERDPKMVAKSFNEILGIEPTRTISKSDPDRFDQIVEKFNPYHDAKGRFASANGATSFTYAPGKSRAHDLAIARANAKERVAKAKEAEPKLTAMMTGCAKEAGGEMVGLEYAVKGQDSLTRKIKTEMSEKGCSAAEATASMKDVNRYTMQLDETNFVSGFESTMKTLSDQGYELVRVKNTMGDTSAAYRGVNCNIKSPDGSIWELQFHTAKSLEVKEVNHKLYETQRLDKTPAAKKAELGATMAANAASIPSPVGIEKIANVNKL